jgi:hypothetical protein
MTGSSFLEGLVGALRILRGDSLAAAHRGDLRLELLAGHDVEREQQVLGRHVVVLHALRRVERLVKQLRDLRRHVRLLLRAVDARLGGERRLRVRAQRVRVGYELARQLLVEQRDEQMLRIELRIARAARKLLRCGDGLLALDRQLVEIQSLHLLSGNRSPR